MSLAFRRRYTATSATLRALYCRGASLPAILDPPTPSKKENPAPRIRPSALDSGSGPGLAGTNTQAASTSHASLLLLFLLLWSGSSSTAKLGVSENEYGEEHKSVGSFDREVGGGGVTNGRVARGCSFSAIY
ncbi:hypothetical protein B0H14DRAFT_2632398 [Mycena olivaceomarginata]|nr:hypothetical protein B0H14DRAFT_2632398 [Mycena olivaceomarginata]